MLNSYNFSSLQAAGKCLQYYKYLCVDKLKTDSPDSADMHFGTALHSGLEASLTGSDSIMAFEVYWNFVKGLKVNYARYGWDELLRQGIVFLNKFDKYYKDKLQIKQLEQRLYSSYNGINIEGTPDFIGLYNGVPTLLDFKTSAYKYDADKINCAEQLYLYTYLARQAGFEVEQIMYLVFVKGESASIQKPLIKTVTTQDLNRVLDNVQRICEDLNTRQHYNKNTRNCIMGTMKCEYFDKCWSNK